MAKRQALTGALILSGVAAAVLGCGGGSSAVPVSTPKTTGLISISGTHILRDKKAWVAHGFNQIAFVAPPPFFSQEPKQFFVTAQQDYSSAEYTQIAQFGGDSVRLQVSQVGLDPNGKYHTADYENLVLGAVKDARAAGLTVIVSDQDEMQSGEVDSSGKSTEVGLPTVAAQGFWTKLIQEFGQDAGVIFELYNEPFVGPATNSPPTTADWQAWAAAMNMAIAGIRQQGAINVVMADGLQHAEALTGAPTLQDPLGQVIYASHPYAHSADQQKQTSWDAKFGNFAQTAPVMVSEWGLGYFCDGSTDASTQAFLQYLQTKGIGLQITTWDWPPLGFGTAFVNFPQAQLTSFLNLNGQTLCDSNGQIRDGVGPGKMIQSWYQTGTPPTSPL